MKKTILSLLFAFTVIVGIAFGDEPAKEKSNVRAHIAAMLGDAASNKNRQVYIYSKEPLKAVSISEDSRTWVTMTESPRQGDYFIFASALLPTTVTVGQKFSVCGVTNSEGLFTDVLTVEEMKKGSEELSLGVKGDFEVTQNEIYNGGDHLSPRIVAQARVNFMAIIGAVVHFGNAGCLRTNMGALSEGWGNGSGTCTGNGPCYADAWAVGPYGSHHLRFYQGGTFQSGSGGGRGFFRRR